MDSYQHVNNATYFDYITQARHDLLIKPYAPNQKERFFLVDASCEFKTAITYPDTLTAKQYIESIGNSSFALSYEFFNSQQQLCAQGKAIVVTVNQENHPFPVPAYIKELFGEFTAPKKPVEEIEIPTNKILSRSIVPLRWVDIDAFGHVDNSRYFDFMVEARNALIPADSTLYKSYLFFLIQTRCVFYKPFHYPSNIQIKQSLIQVGRSSFTLGYEFFGEDELTLYAKGAATLVCVDPQTKRPVRVAQELASKLSIEI
jgi:acyl-CoA thioester hydrolase